MGMDGLRRGAAAFLRIEGERDAADLSCDIGTLTILMFGYKRPAELARYGLVTGSPTALEWLEEIIPQAETALLIIFRK